MDACSSGHCYRSISNEETVDANNCNGSFNRCNLGNSFPRDELWGARIGTAYNGFSIQSGVEFVDKLLNRGGINGMLGSVAVIIFGLGFGGLLEKLGVLKVIVSKFEKKLNSAGNVTLSTLIVAFLANVFGCAMYVSLILTPKIMEDSYDKLKIDRRVLARNSSRWNVNFRYGSMVG